MPIDPTLKGFLDQFAAAPGPKLWEQSPADARATFVALMQLVGPKDLPIGRVEDLSIPAPHGTIPVRVYSPVSGGSAPLPALIYFHGGGFVIGDLDTHDGLCRMFANEAVCRVIAVHYRLAPEHKFPAAADDAYAALVFAKANASRLGIDPNAIAVGGDSAGGNLAAVVAQMAKEKGGPKLVYQMLLFPVTQIGGETKSLNAFAEGYFLEKKALEWFYASYITKGQNSGDPKLSPLEAKDLRGLPPAFVMLGGFDPLHDEGLSYAQKLREAGVPVTIDDHADMVHCFVYLQAVVPQAVQAMKTASAALRKAFKN